MAKGKPSFYAVKIGRVPGVYLTWDECKQQVHGYPGARYKMFHKREEADEWNGQYTSDQPKAQDEEPNQHREEGLTSDMNPVASGSKEAVPSSAFALTCSDSPSVAADVDRKGKKRAFDVVDDLSIPKIQLSAEVGEDLVVYCDGACKGNGQPGSIAGVGVWWGPRDNRNIAERCPGAQTNNRAELIALGRVLESTPISRRRLIVKTDSQYTINCFEKWIHKWFQNGFKTAKGEAVSNPSLIRYIHTLLSGRINLGQKVKLSYVKGHSGDTGNDGADAQANYGARMCEVEERDWERLEEHYRREVNNIMDALEESDVEPQKEDMEVEGSEKIEDEVETFNIDDAAENPSKKRKVSEETSDLARAAPGPFVPSKPRSKPDSNAKLPSHNELPSAPASPSKSTTESRKARLEAIQQAISPPKPKPSGSGKQSRLAAIEAALSPEKSKPAADTSIASHSSPSNPKRSADATTDADDVFSSSSKPKRPAISSPTKTEPTNLPSSTPNSPSKPLTPKKRQRLAFIQEGLSASKAPMPKLDFNAAQSSSSSKTKPVPANSASKSTAPQVVNALSKDELEAFAEVWDDDMSALTE